MGTKTRPLGNNVRWALDQARLDIQDARRLLAKAAETTPFTQEVITVLLLRIALKLSSAEALLLTIPTEAREERE